MEGKHLCPACNNTLHTGEGFCSDCHQIAQQNGIDDKEYLRSLPSTERITMHLPTALDITSQLLTRMQAR